MSFLPPQRMKATKCPSDEISLSNKVAVNHTDFPDDVEYVLCCCQQLKLVKIQTIDDYFHSNVLSQWMCFLRRLFKIGTSVYRLGQVNISYFQSFEHQTCPRTVLVSRWYNENGRPSR